MNTCTYHQVIPINNFVTNDKKNEVPKSKLQPQQPEQIGQSDNSFWNKSKFI